ncbi:MAG TPA: nucleotidyltransferase family protein [Candidatus Binatia bacterium]|nr:nucleotidyltransferase family protein [Candidatus Binatia bacterium]
MTFDGSRPAIADYVAIAREVGFGRPATVVDALRALGGPPHEIAAALRSHHLLGFAQRALREASAEERLSPELLAALAAQRPIQRAAPEELLATFDEVRRALARAAIEARMLKGLYLAQRLYGGIDRRPQFDVDVLVRRRDLRRAVVVLRAAGFTSQAYDLHSRTVIRNGLKVDLHGSLRWAPAYRIDEEALWRRSRDVVIDGLSVPTLSDEDTLLLLLLAAFEDLGQATSNLKQLLDVALFLRDVEPTANWGDFFARRARENVLGVSVNAIAVVLDAFAMRDELPCLQAELARHAGDVVHADREAALALVGAPPKAAESLRWFRHVYPGSMLHYVAWFWASGLPGNLRQIGRPWLAQSFGLFGRSPGAR